MRPAFPFSAIVGNEMVKKAIRCALASPDLRSLLICGPGGTGKSVIASSIRSLDTGRDMIVLPRNVTEDRLFGGMDVGKAIGSGERMLSDSILKRADGNILLVENVNIVPERLMHQVLNATETGMNTVERDGVSGSYDCRMLLIATMRPDEGPLSEHLLDRFDMCIFTSNIEDEYIRGEIARRSSAYWKDPVHFSRSYAEEDAAESKKIADARARVRFTLVPDGYCGAISEVCNSLNVAGHRGDIAVMNAARALAAMDGRDMTSLDDLRNAATMCLEHRRNDQDNSTEAPPEPPENDEQDGQDDDRGEEQEPPDDDEEREEQYQQETRLPPPPMQDPDENVFSVGDVFQVIDYLSKEDRKKEKGMNGKRAKAVSKDKIGRCIGYRIPRGRVRDIALCASIMAAAPHQVSRDHSELAIVLEKGDLREKVRERKQGTTILFLVDGSGSIGAQKRMVAVKGAILSMLMDAYQKRDEIGMVVFRIDRAEEVLEPTKSVLKASKALQDIPTGGRTPLTHGLLKGYEVLKGRITRDSRPVMVILSDGRCNVPYAPGMAPVDEMLATARSLSSTGIRFVAIDTEAGRLRMGLILELCRALDGTYLRLEGLDADYIERSVRMAMND